MMTKNELVTCLVGLKLNQVEAAQLLGVAPRTVRRWIEGEEVPGPAEAAIRAWRKLASRHLPWKPDSVSLIEDDQDQISRHRTHAVGFNALIERVEKRGGPRVSWKVDRRDCTAVLGPLEISYYKLLNGSFSLATYTRKDGSPDLVRDQELIEDAAFCIAKELKKAPEAGPVTLVYHKGTWRQGTLIETLEEFPTNEMAIQRVCTLLGTVNFIDPFIMSMSKDHSELLWDKEELRQECERRKKGPSALEAVAEYAQQHSVKFARGPRPMSPGEAAQRRKQIEKLADKIKALAVTAKRGLVSYQDFEPLLRELHNAGFFPDAPLISAVAEALVRA